MIDRRAFLLGSSALAVSATFVAPNPWLVSVELHSGDVALTINNSLVFPLLGHSGSLQAGDIVEGEVVRVVFDGADWRQFDTAYGNASASADFSGTSLIS